MLEWGATNHCAAKRWHGVEEEEHCFLPMLLLLLLWLLSVWLQNSLVSELHRTKVSTSGANLEFVSTGLRRTTSAPSSLYLSRALRLPCRLIFQKIGVHCTLRWQCQQRGPILVQLLVLMLLLSSSSLQLLCLSAAVSVPYQYFCFVVCLIRCVFCFLKMSCCCCCCCCHEYYQSCSHSHPPHRRSHFLFLLCIDFDTRGTIFDETTSHW